jgi:hypothetical protein
MKGGQAHAIYYPKRLHRVPKPGHNEGSQHTHLPHKTHEAMRAFQAGEIFSGFNLKKLSESQPGLRLDDPRWSESEPRLEPR